jgi:hypothetical protein
MEPTRAYLAAPETGRTRPTEAVRGVRVVVENYSDSSNVFGRSDVYLSTDHGKSWSKLPWTLTLKSWWRALGRQWPPHDLYITSLDEARLNVSYVDNEYDGPLGREAVFDLRARRWHLLP